MKVSIITPAYNCENYIEKYFESVLNQSYRDIEVIVIDDGSIDNTSNIIKKYEKIDDRIIYKYQPNQGASVARNYGVSIAKGEYLLFIDSDDYIDNKMIEVVMNKIALTNADVVCFAHYKVINNNEEAYTFGWECEHNTYNGKFGLEKILSFEIKGYICDKIFRLDKWKSLGLTFEKGRYCEDWFPIANYISNSNTVAFINEPLYYYVQHESSSIHTSNIKVISDYDYAVTQILKLEKLKHNSYGDLIAYFKINAFLEIIHELYKVSNVNKMSIY